MFADEHLEKIAAAKTRINDLCAEKKGLERIQSETEYKRILAGTDSDQSDSTAIRIELYEPEHHPERYLERIRQQYWAVVNEDEKEVLDWIEQVADTNEWTE